MKDERYHGGDAGFGPGDRLRAAQEVLKKGAGQVSEPALALAERIVSEQGEGGKFAPDRLSVKKA